MKELIIDLDNPKSLTAKEHAEKVIKEIQDSIEWMEAEKYLVKTRINNETFYSLTMEKLKDYENE